METGGDSKREQALVEVVPLGPVPALLLQIVAASLQTHLGLAADLAPMEPEPPHALIAHRGQLDAGPILKSLACRAGPAPLKFAVTASDLCVPILTFVYGESQLGGSCAVMSLCRLVDDDDRVFLERAAKVAGHEMAHVLGLGHCREPGCLMRFSKDLFQLDLLPLDFCPACAYELARGRRRLAGMES